MTIDALPTAPSRGDTAADFIAKSDAFVAALATMVSQINASAAGYNVDEWVSGTTYVAGNLVWSPIDFTTYRRKTNGAGTTDPSADPTNWAGQGQLPAGTIIDFAADTVLSGFLACDGSNVSRTTYATLFAAIGTTHGVGDGSTTFALPDSRRRTHIGSGGSGTATVGNAVGNHGGEEAHSLTSGENGPHGHGSATGTPSAQHTHAQQDGGSFFSDGAGANAYRGTTGSGVLETTTSYESNTHTHSIATDGSGTAHNTMQPSLVVKKLIKF